MVDNPAGQLSEPVRSLADKADDATQFLKKLANRDRLLICCALTEGECSVRQLEDRLDLRQPGLSQQLAELRAAGMVSGRKQGKQVFYSLADSRIERFTATLYDLFCT